MSNYVWKQVENIRQDMVSVLEDSGFEVMLMPSKLTINRGNEKVIESDIGEVYMPNGKYNAIFTHSISNDHTVYIVNR